MEKHIIVPMMDHCEINIKEMRRWYSESTLNYGM